MRTTINPNKYEYAWRHLRTTAVHMPEFTLRLHPYSFAQGAGLFNSKTYLKIDWCRRFREMHLHSYVIGI